MRRRSRSAAPTYDGKGPDDTITLAQLVALVAAHCVRGNFDTATKYSRARSRVTDAIKRKKTLPKPVAGGFLLSACAIAFRKYRWPAYRTIRNLGPSR